MRKLFVKIALLGGLSMLGAAALGVGTASAQCNSRVTGACFGGDVLNPAGNNPAYNDPGPVYNDPGPVPVYDNGPRYHRNGWNGGQRHGWRRGWDDGPRHGWRSPGYRSNRYIYVDRYVPVYPSPRRVYREYDAPRYNVNLTKRHVRWCANRYQTYRAWDNTYKPTLYTRAQCISPYS